jgi:hypothetical protein
MLTALSIRKSDTLHRLFCVPMAATGVVGAPVGQHTNKCLRQAHLNLKAK